MPHTNKMGASLAAIAQALDFSALAKYCRKAMDLESECCEGCRCHYHTEPTPIESSGYDFEVDTGGLHFSKN